MSRYSEPQIVFATAWQNWDLQSQASTDIASKWVHVVIQNLVTFPKYQKRKFENFEIKFFYPTPVGDFAPKLFHVSLILIEV